MIPPGGYTFAAMKSYFRQILVFCGAIAVLVLALGTFCTDQWIMKAQHHPHSGIGAISHLDAAETMCHSPEPSIVALSPKSPESRSETGFSGETGRFIAADLVFSESIDRFFRKTFLFSSFSLARHQEIRYVVFRS